ncbi:MAG TPA: MarR family winged helix-turn-helix transcriptional regulator [Acidimicrobiales bacterium]
MGTPTAARQITEAITRLFMSSQLQGQFHGTACELGLTPPMLKGLFELEPGDPATMGRLAEAWHCDASFVTVTVDGLEERGLVKRRVAKHDRRVKTVELTGRGIRTRDKALASVFAPLAGFAALDPGELTALADLITRVAAEQAAHDEAMLADPDVRQFTRRMAAQRQRGFGPPATEAGGPGAAGGPQGTADGQRAGEPPGWRVQLEEQKRELRELRAELERVRAAVQERELSPRQGAKLAKSEVKAAKGRASARARAVRDDVRPGRRDRPQSNRPHDRRK